ncbi:uncharacterized protein LOC136077956 isoform X2 [Hydra vulgaris]|uniref:Uncharacterized protein LOC136077956 isoform X2 n=1 Tax=Hydra vulgaris TaxID=6087 RepID=A0ABM4BHF3_HYDVU
MELNNPINIFAVQDNSNKISQTIIDHVIPVEDEYSVDFNVKKDEDKKGVGRLYLTFFLYYLLCVKDLKKNLTDVNVVFLCH